MFLIAAAGAQAIDQMPQNRVVPTLEQRVADLVRRKNIFSVMAIGVTLLLAICGATVIAFAVKALVGLRPTEEVESIGLDLAELGEEGCHG